MQGREQLTLDQSIRRAGAAGPLSRSEAVAVFLEVLRLASDSQAIPDAGATLLEEDGSLTFRTSPGHKASDPEEPIRAACRLAKRLFGAANLEAPLSLAAGGAKAPERFPTLRHLRDAFELELLLSGTPPPNDAERRMVIAAVMARARQPRSQGGGSSRPREALPPTDPPPVRFDLSVHLPPRVQVQPRTEPDRFVEPPPRVPPHSLQAFAPPEPQPPSWGDDPSTWVTEPPAPLAPPRPLPWDPRPHPLPWDALIAAVRRAQPQWLQLAAVGAMGIWIGVLLGRGLSRKAAPELPPVVASMAPEIALPPPDVRPPPAVAESKGPARANASQAAPAQPQEASPRPLRKLRRRAAATVADAGPVGGTKLQAGDDSLRQGRFFEALMAYREALDQDPPVPAAARRLGDAYREHQDTDQAVTAYERYLELAPSAPDADEVRAAVEQLRSSTPVAR